MKKEIKQKEEERQFTAGTGDMYCARSLTPHVFNNLEFFPTKESIYIMHFEHEHSRDVKSAAA